MVLEMNTPHDSNLLFLERIQESAWPVISNSNVREMKTLNHACHRMPRLSFRWCNERAEHSPRIPGNRNH